MEVKNIYVNKERKKVWKKIEKMSERDNRSLSEFIFLILKEYVERKEKKKNFGAVDEMKISEEYRKEEEI